MHTVWGKSMEKEDTALKNKPQDTKALLNRLKVDETMKNIILPTKSKEDVSKLLNQKVQPSGSVLGATKPASEIIPAAGIKPAGDVSIPQPKEKKKKPLLKSLIGAKSQKEEIKVEKYDPEMHGAITSFEGVLGYEEVERYWVIEPYAFVVILHSKEKNEYLYYVVEPAITQFEKTLLEEIHNRLEDILILDDVDASQDKESILEQKVVSIINDFETNVEPLTLYKLLYYIKRNFIGIGKIAPLMNDQFIEDISCNGIGVPVYLYHKNYENISTNVVFDEKGLDSFVIRLAQRSGKHISIAEPMVDSTMPDGSRIQMTLGRQITTRGSTFTIRKFKETPITPVDLIVWGTFNSEVMAYFWLCIENNKSLIFAGGTASGKTTTLNAVALYIPPKSKIVTLEDTRELKLPHPNWIPGMTRDSFTADGRGAIDMYELLRAALRQRPEYLIVGEVRGKEALTLFQAMSTGHTTFSTMHADSVASAIYRLENPPISVPRSMIQALNIMSIQAQTYTKGKRVRRNMKVVEITDIDPVTRNIRTVDIFVWDSITDRFERIGDSKMLRDIAERRGWSKSQLNDELKRRQNILEYLVKQKIRDFNTIANIIRDYYVNPEKTLKELKLM